MWFCQECTLNNLQKDKTLFPKHVVGFRRYNEEKLNTLIEKTGRKFSTRSISTIQEEKLEKIEAKEAKRPKSDQALFEESMHNMLKDIRDFGLSDWSPAMIEVKIKEVEDMSSVVSHRMKSDREKAKVATLIN